MSKFLLSSFHHLTSPIGFFDSLCFLTINKSLNETLSRTITTSVTTLLALFAIYFVGGEVISDFTLAMIWGVMIGTYSSIFVASAFLTFFNLRRTREEEKEDLNYFNNE